MTVVVKPVAVIGPSATGKSALGVELALRLGGEVVNCDAAAQYRGMDIGTAKPSHKDRRGVAHHQLDVLEIEEIATVARYQEAASADIEDIVSRGSIPIIVGGSMLYVQALLDQWTIPATDPRVRAQWEQELASRGVDALHAHLATLDPAAASVIHPHDERRVVRALEVVTLTGQPYAATMPTQQREPRWGTRILGVDRETGELDERIERRTEAMFDAGLIEEVEGLVQRGLREGVTASKLIGYTQILDFLDNKFTQEQARTDITLRTRRYVRRQRSWFRRDPRVQWLDAADPQLLERALEYVG